MKIGVVKEVKQDEQRVALTPAATRELVHDGHEVLVETSAGIGSSFSDEMYSMAGAEVRTAEAVWADADLLVKVKEPVEREYGFLRSSLTLFTYLHLAADRSLTDALVASGARALAYETLELADGTLPLLAPMSEVAGRLAAQAGAQFLEVARGGRGLLFGGVPGVAPARVVILGGGIVGYNAAVIALGLGADVTIIDRSLARLRFLDTVLHGRARLLMASALQIERSVVQSDVVIGAVLVTGSRAPLLVSADLVAEMQTGAVLCDVAIDQGGCFETSRATTHANPSYTVGGVVHYCVANMPGAVPITSTQALTNATLPYIRELAAAGISQALRHSSEIATSANVIDGAIVHKAVADAHSLEHTTLDSLIRAA